MYRKICSVALTVLFLFVIPGCSDSGNGGPAVQPMGEKMLEPANPVQGEQSTGGQASTSPRKAKAKRGETAAPVLPSDTVPRIRIED